MGRKDVLDGLDTFMEDSLVLPTGQEYEDDTLLPILQKLVRKRKETKMLEDQMRKGLSHGSLKKFSATIWLIWTVNFPPGLKAEDISEMH